MPSDTPSRITAIRVAGAVTVGLGLLVMAALTLSDRLPRLISAVERRSELIDSISVPGDAYTFGHLVVWAALAFVAAFVPRTMTGVIAVAAALFTLSFGLEVGQQLFTTTRVAEIRDLQANLAGITIGTVAGAVVAATSRLAAAHRQA